MRMLERDKQIIYYALYEGVEEVQKDGVYTGARKKVYGNVTEVKMPISGARTAYGFVANVVTMDIFGMDKPYSKTMWTEDMDCPITEETIVWLNQGKLSEYSEQTEYQSGDKVIYDGKIYAYNSQSSSHGEFDPSLWALVPHNHIVTGISLSPNSIGYALKEVDFRESSN